MAIWYLWAVLITGDRLEAGQYQTKALCMHGARMQRVFWLAHIPKVKYMRCELILSY